MATTTIALFDVDGTLTPARKEATAEMLQFLKALKGKVRRPSRFTAAVASIAARLPAPPQLPLAVACAAAARHGAPRRVDRPRKRTRTAACGALGDPTSAHCTVAARPALRATACRRSPLLQVKTGMVGGSDLVKQKEQLGSNGAFALRRRRRRRRRRRSRPASCSCRVAHRPRTAPPSPSARPGCSAGDVRLRLPREWPPGLQARAADRLDGEQGQIGSTAAPMAATVCPAGA